jgi:hypothetical protein
MRHMHIIAGVCVNAINIDDPAKFPDMRLIRSDTAEIGDFESDGVFTKDPAREAAAQAEQIERALKADAEAAIKAETVVAEIKGKTWNDYSTVWWPARSAAYKDALLKYLVWAVVHRVL